jgi:hypothetical protein
MVKKTPKYVDAPRYKLIEAYEENFKLNFGKTLSALTTAAVRHITQAAKTNGRV